MSLMVAPVAFTVRRMDSHIDGDTKRLTSSSTNPRVICERSSALISDGRVSSHSRAVRVAAGLAGLDLVPKPSLILRPGRGIFGDDDEGLFDALLSGVIVDAALALALDALADT